MREFTKWSPTIWIAKNFQALKDWERLQYLYLATGPHQTSAGCYYLSVSYACGDLNFTPARYRAANVRLRAAGLIEFDDDTSEVLIVGWFKDNGPMNDKHAVGIQREMAKIKSSELRRRCFEDFEAAWAAHVNRSDAKARRIGGYELPKRAHA